MSATDVSEADSFDIAGAVDETSAEADASEANDVTEAGDALEESAAAADASGDADVIIEEDDSDSDVGISIASIENVDDGWQMVNDIRIPFFSITSVEKE